MEEFLEWRDGAIERLYGVRRPRDPLRDAVLRKAVLSLGDGAARSIAYYQRECSALGSRTAIRDVIYDLEANGLLILRQKPTGRRKVIVTPTVRVVAWYGICIREMLQIIARRLREDS